MIFPIKKKKKKKEEITENQLASFVGNLSSVQVPNFNWVERSNSADKRQILCQRSRAEFSGTLNPRVPFCFTPIRIRIFHSTSFDIKRLLEVETVRNRGHSLAKNNCDFFNILHMHIYSFVMGLVNLFFSVYFVICCRVNDEYYI